MSSAAFVALFAICDPIEEDFSFAFVAALLRNSANS
jgi:hypothetical protein